MQVTQSALYFHKMILLYGVVVRSRLGNWLDMGDQIERIVKDDIQVSSMITREDCSIIYRL